MEEGEFSEAHEDMAVFDKDCEEIGRYSAKDENKGNSINLPAVILDFIFLGLSYFCEIVHCV